jgi:hypothetical protein
MPTPKTGMKDYELNESERMKELGSTTTFSRAVEHGSAAGAFIRFHSFYS